MTIRKKTGAVASEGSVGGVGLESMVHALTALTRQAAALRSLCGLDSKIALSSYISRMTPFDATAGKRQVVITNKNKTKLNRAARS